MLVHSVQPGNRESRNQFPKEHYLRSKMWPRPTKRNKKEQPVDFAFSGSTYR